MTREEAKRRLLNIERSIPNTFRTKEDVRNFEALEMAIKALEQNESAEEWYKLFVEKLEQEPSGDLISRQAVLNQIFYSTDNSGDVVLGSALRHRIEKIPSVEQEPCDDAISREAVLEKAVYTETEEGWYGYTVDVDDIKVLPSVKQEPKIGYWDNVSICGYRCSECGKIQYAADVNELNYCCNCGARMVEPQESDRKCHTCKHYTSGENDGSCGSYICKGHSDWESEDKE